MMNEPATASLRAARARLFELCDAVDQSAELIDRIGRGNMDRGHAADLNIILSMLESVYAQSAMADEMGLSRHVDAGVVAIATLCARAEDHLAHLIKGADA